MTLFWIGLLISGVASGVTFFRLLGFAVLGLAGAALLAETG